jgi:hypothetical protein
MFNKLDPTGVYRSMDLNLDDAIHLNQMEIYRLKVRKINFVENVLW